MHVGLSLALAVSAIASAAVPIHAPGRLDVHGAGGRRTGLRRACGPRQAALERIVAQFDPVNARTYSMTAGAEA